MKINLICFALFLLLGCKEEEPQSVIIQIPSHHNGWVIVVFGLEGQESSLSDTGDMVYKVDSNGICLTSSKPISEEYRTKFYLMKDDKITEEVYSNLANKNGIGAYGSKYSDVMTPNGKYQMFIFYLGDKTEFEKISDDVLREKVESITTKLGKTESQSKTYKE